MDRSEKRGLFKGLGIATIICTAIFYMMVLTLRTDYKAQTIGEEDIIKQARDLGMVHITDSDLEEALSEAYIIERAKALGMIEE